MNYQVTFLLLILISGCATLDQLVEKPAIFNVDDETACGFIILQLPGQIKLTVIEEKGSFEFDSAADVIAVKPEIGGKRKIAFVRSMLIETPKATISITKVDPYWVNQAMFHRLAGEFDIVHIEEEQAPKPAPEETKPSSSPELETAVT